MNKIQLNILLFSLLSFFPASNVFSQDNSILSEINLSDKTTKQKAATTDKTTQNPTSSLSQNILPQLDSLMFDSKESDSIDHVISLLKNNQIYGIDENLKNTEDQKNIQENQTDTDAVKEKTKSYIYLGSIIYLNSNGWAVWINDKKVTPETNTRDKEIYLKSVERDQVKVLWTPSVSKWKILLGQKSETLSPKINANNQVEMEFDLKPNQSFVLRNNSVIEGTAEQMIITEDQTAATKSKTANQKNNKQIVNKTNLTTDLIPANSDIEKPVASLDQNNSSENSNINKSIGAITEKLKGIIPTNPSAAAISDSEF